MVWTETCYPSLMENLPLIVRRKAIEIANALDKENMEENALVELAIKQAKEWIANSPQQSDEPKKKTVIRNDEHLVIPYGEKEWAVKEKGRKKVIYVFHTKKKAIELATSVAKKANTAVTIQKRSGAVEKRISFKPDSEKKRTAIITKKSITKD